MGGLSLTSMWRLGVEVAELDADIADRKADKSKKARK